MKFLAMLFATAIMMISCGDDNSGKSLNAPQIEPPVAEATPAALKTSTTALSLRDYDEFARCDEGDTDCFEDRALSRLVIRIFQGKEGCKGDAPDDMAGRIRCNLHKVDSRMAELDTRATESERKCQNEAAKEFTRSLPAGITRTAKFQCGEVLSTSDDEDGASSLAFGIDGSDFYLMENKEKGWLTYAHANTSTNDYEVLIGSNKPIQGGLVGDASDGTATGGSEEHDGMFAISLIHLKANSEANSFEIAIGANHSIGNGVGCGVQLRSDGSYIYAKGIFDEPDSTTIDTACDNTEDYLETCLDATTLETVESSKCSSINSFSVASILPTGFEQSDVDVYGDASYLTELTGFNVDAETD